jgi:ADP-ribose pyrophosphatase YjhB (NUDIX family)
MEREYPNAPIAAVAATIFSDDSVLLVRRGNEPSRGRWGLPGGVVELGETVGEAVVREVKEETGIDVRPVRLITAVDSIVRNDEGRVRFHYIIFEYLCEATGGTLNASSDVQDARWLPLNKFDAIDILPWTRRFIEGVKKGR